MIFLGIGSNLSSSFGDRFANIDLAISLLKKQHQIITKNPVIKRNVIFQTKKIQNL